MLRFIPTGPFVTQHASPWRGAWARNPPPPSPEEDMSLEQRGDGNKIYLKSKREEKKPENEVAIRDTREGRVAEWYLNYVTQLGNDLDDSVADTNIISHYLSTAYARSLSCPTSRRTFLSPLVGDGAEGPQPTHLQKPICTNTAHLKTHRAYTFQSQVVLQSCLHFICRTCMQPPKWFLIMNVHRLLVGVRRMFSQ